MRACVGARIWGRKWRAKSKPKGKTKGGKNKGRQRDTVMLCDGGGLYLQVTLGKDKNVRRSWIFRY